MPVLDKFLSVVAPYNCLNCGDEGSLVCKWCLPDFAPVLPPTCYMCNALSTDSRVCEKCRPKSRLSHVWVRTQYQDGPKQLVSKLKFQRAAAASKVIAELMHETIGYLPADTLLVPVPTATKRVRQRGYDQAKLLAKELSKLFVVDYIFGLRRRSQLRQLGQNRNMRLAQLENVFTVTSTRHIRGSHIVLVDDVITTGATLESAARALREAGAQKVDALVFAVTNKL